MTPEQKSILLQLCCCLDQARQAGVLDELRKHVAVDRNTVDEFCETVESLRKATSQPVLEPLSVPAADLKTSF